MENKEQKTNFLKKVWYSISKFEKYPDMATEGVMKALKYLFCMVCIVTVFVLIGSMAEINKLVDKLAVYINDNIPEFSYSSGNIIMETEEPIIIEDFEYSGVDKIVIDPYAENNEQKSKDKEEYNVNGTTIYFFKNQIILLSKSEDGQTKELPYTYSDFIKSYTGQNINEFNKKDLVEYMVSSEMNSYYVRYGVALFLNLLLLNILVALLDAFELTILGWITTMIARIRMRFVAIYNMAIYALTLPMILNIVYIIVNYFTKFTISYFQVAYITIAYVYLVASIFIIRDDFMKRQEELNKINQEQLKVKEEIRRQEEEKKEGNQEKPEKKKEKKEEDNNNGEEPEGSKA